MKYRKKPVVIEAFRFGIDQAPGWFMRQVDAKNVKVITKLIYDGEYDQHFGDDDVACVIKTLEGKMRANKGDYIIMGLRGELYPCKPDIFEATYEAVEEPAGGGSYDPDAEYYGHL